MFKRREKPVFDVVWEVLRKSGLETPLLQRQLIAAWPEVVGDVLNSLTRELYIRNQTLYVKMEGAALRAEMNYKRQPLVKALNAKVKAQVIADIRFI